MICQFTMFDSRADKGRATVVVQGSSFRNVLDNLMDYCQSVGRMDFYHNSKHQHIEDEAKIISSDLEPKCD